MFRFKSISAVMALSTVAACGAASNSVNEPADAVPRGPEEVVVTPASTPPVAIGDHQLGRICRAAIGALMARDPANIGVDSVSNGIAQVSYTRVADGKVWKNRCRIQGDRVIWGVVDTNTPDSGNGGWRDAPTDQVTTYRIREPNVLITQAYKSGPLESAFHID